MTRAQYDAIQEIAENCERFKANDLNIRPQPTQEVSDMQINNVITFGDNKPMTWQQALEQMMEDAKRMRERNNAVE